MDIAEKRVYDASAGRIRLAVATGNGLAVVGISADVIGEFGLALREPVRDVVAVGGGRLLAATAEDLLVVTLGEGGVAETVATAGTGAGATAAVTTTGDAVVTAGSDGVVRRAPLSAVLDVTESSESASSTSGGSVEWTELGEATVRAADGSLLAAADGVYRVGTDSIDHVGLDDVRDVAVPKTAAVDADGAGTAPDRTSGASGAPVGPFAATGDGLFRLGPGWTEERSGGFDLVAVAAGTGSDATLGPEPDTAPDAGSDTDRPTAHAAVGAELLARTADGWSAVAWPPSSPVAGVVTRPGAEGGADDGDSDRGDFGDGNDFDGDDPDEDAARHTYAVAADGTVLADAGDGWRTRSIGLPDVAGCAIVE